MKQTAVDWFFNNLKSHEIQAEHLSLYEKAKEMERKQIVEAHGRQLKKTQTAGNYEYWLTGEKYYRENYGQL